MRSNRAPLDLDGGSGPRWPSRLGRALGITALQVIAAAVVFALFLIPASNAPSEGPDDWAGFEYIVMGVFAAPAAAVILGLIVASRMRMPLYGLYALPALLAAAGYIAPFITDLHSLDLPVLPVFIGGNLLIALATVRLPRRPRRPPTGVPF
ncbi:hypothetical protein [Glycomyces tritici]|uniref:Integral membrane protein n=1 Tax=Glycomyces tritici TaxID=2665176 RepID=A0ABT7YLU4_9ACTN|nr:hypothetical protein [Glycomyces tritici]MDN3239588.1 hypothetical protein [Glycomyces tritici]